MKAFTSLMKIAMMIVSIAVTAMLVITAAPILMGGINVEESQPIQIAQDGINITITGEYKVDSTLPNDIKDLKFQIYAETTDKKTVLPIHTTLTDVKSNSETLIPINTTLSLADITVFLVNENGNSGQGIYLPLKIAIGGYYNDNMMGLDMVMTYKYKLSDSASISVETGKNSAGEVNKITANISGDSAEIAQIKQMIPDNGSITIKSNAGGALTDMLEFNFDNSAGGISVEIKTSDDTDSLKNCLKSLVDSNEDLTLEYNLGSGDHSTTITHEQLESLYAYISANVDKFDPATLGGVSP